MNFIFLISLFSLFKDNLIHASIRKSFVNHFRDIQESKIYRVKYFGVVENKDAYRIVNHKYMIRFYATTSVKLLETNDELIAKQKIELVPFDELKYLADKNTTLTSNFDYTFILKIYLYTIIYITHYFD